MREILFRGKRKNTQDWVYGDLVTKQNICIANTWHEVIRVKDETVGQFTGLTDKNGKQIFEGDILRLCDATCPCEIYWSGIGWAFKRKGKRVDYNYGSSLVIDCEKMQVIGNIYDNPELLGGAE